MVPLQGAIVVCYRCGGRARPILGSGRGAIAGCHCSALWLQGAIVVCYVLGGGWTNFGGVDGGHCWVP